MPYIVLGIIAFVIVVSLVNRGWSVTCMWLLLISPGRHVAHV